MSIDQLPFNFFDVLLVVLLVAGILRGRKHGMSEELMGLLMWVAIVFGCAVIYQPGGDLIGQFTNLFGRLTCYLVAYVVGALLVVLLFAGIKRGLDGKLLGSDVFGRSEYYLGMGAGLVRFSCILLAVLALLNARYFSPAEVRAMEKYRHRFIRQQLLPGPALGAGDGLRRVAYGSLDQGEPGFPVDHADGARGQATAPEGIRDALGRAGLNRANCSQTRACRP